MILGCGRNVGILKSFQVGWGEWYVQIYALDLQP